MNGFRSFLLVLGLGLASVTLTFASASDVYITPDGKSQGACTSNTQTPSWFNSGANWGSSAGQIGPGTTVHLCGAFTGSAGANGLITQGDGASGNPVVIKFETGASMKSPAWGTSSTQPTGGAIVINDQWITVDGNNTGVIQNTLNGTSGGNCPSGGCNVQKTTAGVFVADTSHVVVKNLTIADMYDRTPCSGDSTNANSYGIFVTQLSGSNMTDITISGNKVHDALNSIAVSATTSSHAIDNVHIVGNSLSHASAEVVFAAGGANGLMTNSSVSSNNIFDNYYFWDPADDDHLNGMHLFAAGGSNAKLQNITINNNYIHGDFGGQTCGGGGSHTTSFIYLEATGGGLITGGQLFNNLLVSGSNDDAAGGLLGVGDGGASGTQIYNNTIVGTNAGNGICMLLTGTVSIKNNICSKLNYFVYGNGSGKSQITAADHNLFFNGNTQFRLGNSTYNFSQWQGLGFDANSKMADPNLDGSFHLQSGSPGIGQSVNLTNLGIQALDSDMASAARPGCQGSCPAWDIGVYNFSTADAPNPPAGLAAVVN